MFIKKIFENNPDEQTHRQFVRFGKGTYGGRALINVTNQKDKIKASTSFELANDLVEFVSNIAEVVSINGVILSKEPIQELNIAWKKKQSIYEGEINKKVSGKELKEITKKAYAMLVDCSCNGVTLKIKKKLPKPGKSGEMKIDNKFCQLELDKKFWLNFHSEFLFDFPREFKKAQIEHTYIISEIIFPKNEQDFEKIRLLAKRKGKIVRKGIVDGKEIIKEKEFVV